MKIRCLNPNHKDENASLHVYPEYSYCFSCGFRAKTEEVLSGKEIETLKKVYQEPENIRDTILYVAGLPLATIRGLAFPRDAEGFYIVWPNANYYKKRLYSGNIRYIGPRGHRAPLFEIPGGSNENLIVIEGELNCLTLQSVLEAKPIFQRSPRLCSPGSATEMMRHLEKYLTYSNITIIVDKDIPGVINGLKLKEALLKKGKRVNLLAMERDLNDLLQEKGPEAVRAWAKENLEMQKRV